MKLGYDETHETRKTLAAILEEAASGGKLSEDIISYVRKITGASEEQVDSALRSQIPAVLNSVRAKVKYEEDRLAELARLDEEEKRKAIAREKAVQAKLAGMCPMGFSWYRQGSGWRCTGGSHFVADLPNA